MRVLGTWQNSSAITLAASVLLERIRASGKECIKLGKRKTIPQIGHSFQLMSVCPLAPGILFQEKGPHKIRRDRGFDH